MDKIIFQKGTIIKFEGIPYELGEDTIVLGNTKNLPCVEIKDRTLLKIGKSWAVTIPQKQMKEKGYCLGLPVDIKISLAEMELCDDQSTDFKFPESEDEFDIGKNPSVTCGNGKSE